ncbi:MAG TPA: FlgO family outer membrane protein [Spirochaetota bacterium]|nr:FlgO family outer membrane protein [Spirochaetota bacterium]HOM38557.1 FlgO family outer membrane protein [Spirochaetota bacterium]HPQ49098.1 FlgO family outer membrane protein [Spirochaetota bacterium]
MKKIKLLILLTFIPLLILSENIDIDNVIQYFENKIDKNLVIALENITYKDIKLSSDFSVYITNIISNQIRNSKNFKEFSKKDLEKILEQQELNSSDLFNDKDKTKLGELKSVQAILTGEYIKAGDNILLFLRLVSIKTGTTIESGTFLVPKSKIPEGIEILPSNYNVVKSNYLKDSNVYKGELSIKVWTQKGEGGFYKKGEYLKVFLKSNKNCYVRLFHVDVYGKKKLIFPNQFYPKDKKILGDKVYVIPDETMEFEFELGPPYGTEQIIALASTLPFNDDIKPFAELDYNIPQLLSKTFGTIETETDKGLTVKEVSQEFAYAQVFYTIVKD